jgi:hypothetical protein
MPAPIVHRLVPVAALLFAVVLVAAGCTRVQGPREWSSTAELVSGGTVTVSVRDNSGRIDDIAIDPAGVAVPAGVVNVPGKPNVVLIPWTGGACDRTTAFTINGAGDRLAITIRTTVAPGECDAIGVGHVLRLTATDALPAASITWTP